MIQAILFDMGGTLRKNIKRDEADKARIVQQIPALLGIRPEPDLCSLLTARAAAYEQWASRTLIELTEAELWTQWLLPDTQHDLVRARAMELNAIWREAIAVRVFFPETRPTILELKQRGYKLGLVSNTTSSADSPHALVTEGIADCFGTVILSCVVGRRKPDPILLLRAASDLRLNPQDCAYVGDRPDWDVRAARDAGYGCTIIIRGRYSEKAASVNPQEIPDQWVDNLSGLLTIFPRLPA